MAKLQDLVEAIGKNSSGPEAIRIVEHTSYQAGHEELRETRVMRGDATLGFLTETSAGRWSFRAPDDAKFNDVAPLMKALEDANIKLSDGE